MSDKRVVWTNPDGSVSVLIPAPGVDEALWRKDIPQGVEAVETTADEIPQDRTFRGAWRQVQKSLSVDLQEAKGIAHERRRAKRAAEFAPLDVEATVPLLAVAAEAKRQKIRERYDAVQRDINSANSVETLLSITRDL